MQPGRLLLKKPMKLPMDRGLPKARSGVLCPAVIIGADPNGGTARLHTETGVTHQRRYRSQIMIARIHRSGGSGNVIVIIVHRRGFQCDRNGAKRIGIVQKVTVLAIGTYFLKQQIERPKNSLSRFWKNNWRIIPVNRLPCSIWETNIWRCGSIQKRCNIMRTIEYTRTGILRRRKRYTLAIYSLEACLKMGRPPMPLEFLPGCGTYRPALRLGDLYYALEDYGRVLRYLEAMLRFLDTLLKCRQFDLFEQMLNALNYVDGKDALIRLVLLCEENRAGGLAEEFVLRSIRELEYMDAAGAGILLRQMEA